jgi:leucine dehydrogenase
MMQFRDLSQSELASNEAFDGHERVRRFVLDEGRGIVAFIAVHNTALGPALGGCRIKTYKSEDAALYDVLRLSRGMTYKNAMAGLPLGGGKAVILADPFSQKNDEVMERFGQAVESLSGSYVTAEDSGTSEHDMEVVRNHTRHVTGLSPQTLKGMAFSELGGNPSPVTAIGCFEGIKAAAAYRFSSTDLKGMKAAVQGVGAVGLALAVLMREAGMELTITDVSDTNLKKAKEELGAVKVVRPDEIYGADVDLFVPCALGGVLNDDTIPQITARIIAGPANNQLATPAHEERLAQNGVLYVPDYIINSGGVICVGYEYFMTSGFNPYGFTLTTRSMMDHVRGIGKTVGDILAYAGEQHLNPAFAADRMAEEKFSRAPSPVPLSNSA